MIKGRIKVPTQQLRSKLLSDGVTNSQGKNEKDLELAFFDVADINVLLKAYLDVLLSPRLFVNTENPNQPYYNERAALFNQHFPDASVFEEKVKNQYPAAISWLKSITNDKSKTKVIENLTFIQSKIIILEELLKQANNNQKAYIDVSIKICRRLKQEVDTLIQRLMLTSEELVTDKYQLTRPGLSWKKDPLVFFKNFFLGDGLSVIIEEKNFSEVNSVAELIDIEFRHQTRISFGIIKQTILEYKCADIPDKKRTIQNYIDGVKHQLEVLHNVAENHDQIKIYYKTPERPFYSLIKNLEREFKNNDWNVSFPLDEVYNEPFILKDHFLLKLINHKIKTRDNLAAPLFNNNSKRTKYDLYSFFTGDMEGFQYLDFGWQPMQVYYLLFLACKHGAKLSFRDGYASKVKINGQPFKKEAFQTKKSQFDDSKIPLPSWHSQIDILFIR